jgi:hypothetical protein
MSSTVSIQVTAQKGLALIGVGFARSMDPQELKPVIARLAAEIARIEVLDMLTIAELLDADKEVVNELEHIGWVFRYRYSDPKFPTKLSRAIAGIVVIDDANKPTLN